MDALGSVTINTLGSITSPELQYTVVNGIFIGINSLGLGAGKSYNIVKILICVTTGTEFNDF